MHAVRRAYWVLVALIALNLLPAAAQAEEDHIRWTQAVGVSYPLIVSVAAGIREPLGQPTGQAKQDLDRLAVVANLDLGIGGGMIAGGLYFPERGDDNPGVSGVMVKAAVLRPWIVDIGPQRDRNYPGIVVEGFGAAAGMGFKSGVGYFSRSGSGNFPNDRFIYLYFGVGL